MVTIKKDEEEEMVGGHAKMNEPENNGGKSMCSEFLRAYVRFLEKEKERTSNYLNKLELEITELKGL